MFVFGSSYISSYREIQSSLISSAVRWCGRCGTGNLGTWMGNWATGGAHRRITLVWGAPFESVWNWWNPLTSILRGQKPWFRMTSSRFGAHPCRPKTQRERRPKCWQRRRQWRSASALAMQNPPINALWIQLYLLRKYLGYDVED